ncbi:OmpA family protein [Paracoccus sp. R12_1]|jgi:outer membrane protein OmpA-like peptidoglycan-associated protein|uniref:OmpA family protein n=1 Tax=unclassified Paracoccus (in: a-proteobacteria) TaxID=2688777 RepID=UPI001ADBFC66|nr:MULTISPECIES: OmpA family protein [unclassified Paracoccus (in: a-proteobacteria)]MBO9455924.1 OmpA family protein [Paracoccus sp. R12_2]MBO9486660.1 OmpA family protein [Paracoccus sp. R12_1]
MNLRLTTTIAASGLIALGACTDPSMNPNGTATGMSRTQQGALAGAAIGAVLAGTRDSDKNNQGRDAARGAILGAAAGAVAGNILDRQAAALKQSVSSNVQVVNHGSYLQVVLPEGILFATDSAAVSGPAQSDLYAVARNLNQYPNSRIEVVGHTDSTGSAAYNQDLSQRRAGSVAGILTAAGVNPGRVVAVGRASSQPVASNATAQGRAQNRRVEILIRPTN